MESGGWFEYTAVPLDVAGLARRRAETERFLTEQDLRVEQARQAEFGGTGTQIVESVVMPLSGRTFSWRADGFFRVVEAGVFHDEPGDGLDDWQPWDVDAGMEGASEVSPGDVTDATWWLWWGLAEPEEHVAAWRADDVDVPITRLGYLWIAEWRSPAQPAFVAIGNTICELDQIRPDYLPPAKVPFDQSSPNPRR